MKLFLSQTGKKGRFFPAIDTNISKTGKHIFWRFTPRFILKIHISLLLIEPARPKCYTQSFDYYYLAFILSPLPSLMLLE